MRKLNFVNFPNSLVCYFIAGERSKWEKKGGETFRIEGVSRIVTLHDDDDVHL